MKKYFLSLILFSNLLHAENAYQTTMEYIQKTKKLWGISKIQIVSKQEILLIDAKTGSGSALGLVNLAGLFTEQQVLKIGEYIELVDDHLNLKYQFLGFEGESIKIKIFERFDARSFGGKVQINEAILNVTPDSSN